jgi:DNA-damage-inducible protein D
MFDIGKGAIREVSDFQLSRFACYLIAQNGDSRKPEIASAHCPLRFPDFRHQVVGDIKIRGDVLHVVVVVQAFQKF